MPRTSGKQVPPGEERMNLEKDQFEEDDELSRLEDDEDLGGDAEATVEEEEILIVEEPGDDGEEAPAAKAAPKKAPKPPAKKAAAKTAPKAAKKPAKKPAQKKSKVYGSLPNEGGPAVRLPTRSKKPKKVVIADKSAEGLYGERVFMD